MNPGDPITQAMLNRIADLVEEHRKQWEMLVIPDKFYYETLMASALYFAPKQHDVVLQGVKVALDARDKKVQTNILPFRRKR